MKKSYAADFVKRSSPERLSVLLKIDPSASDSWGAEDLSGLARHQMQAPLDFDLRSVSLERAQQQTASESLTDAGRSNIATFGDLFGNPSPPLKLLKLAQKFFKQNFVDSPKGSPEQKVAYVFYVLSIVAARVRHNVNISKLADEQQVRAIESIMERSWVSPEIRRLLANGLEHILPGPRSPHTASD